MESISIPLDFPHLVARLVLATVLGAAIGVNREMRHKPAGLRTHALVALGAALASVIGVTLTHSPGAGDASAIGRVLQGIFAGIGFIGGGVILHKDDRAGVHGLTTAASIWIVAAIGIASGIGMWRSALITVVLAFLVLILGSSVDKRLRGSD